MRELSVPEPGRRLNWPVIGAAALAVLVLGTLAVVLVRCASSSPGNSLAAAVRRSGTTATGSSDASASASASGSATASASGAASGSASPAGAAAPARFNTLPPGSTLPSAAQCATWARARSYPENKGVNRRANQTTGHGVSGELFSGDDSRAASKIAPRIGGQFTGTTRQILRWAACKWGVDEDFVFAQAAVESWWRQTTQGDWNADASACAPGHGLGADGRAGQCPQSWGILQDRYPYQKSAWPGIANSTAMNADVAYGIWRACFEGYETWLNTVERGRDYAAGDAWGCAGRWFSGRWHTADAENYVTKVRSYLSQRIWETANFQEP